MTSHPILVTHNLEKSYGSIEAVVDIDLEVRSGEVFGLLGPNGAGKTTSSGRWFCDDRFPRHQGIPRQRVVASTSCHKSRLEDPPFGGGRRTACGLPCWSPGDLPQVSDLGLSTYGKGGE